MTDINLDDLEALAKSADRISLGVKLHPDTVLALIERVREAERRAEAALSVADAHLDARTAAIARVEELEAEVLAFREQYVPRITAAEARAERLETAIREAHRTLDHERSYDGGRASRILSAALTDSKED